MPLMRLMSVTLLPVPQEQAWQFFSNPLNLKLLTPEWLHLDILEPELLPQEIYAGLIINYQVKPYRFLKNSWVTEITQLERGLSFVDEQRFGPYAFWHHRHAFQPSAGGIRMTDLVHYKVPGKWIGRFLFGRSVQIKLKDIFDYRFEKIRQLFPGSTVVSDGG